MRRYRDFWESDAIERLLAAINNGRRGFGSPDIIIKAFCDLDIVFFRGALQSHVYVRWIEGWSTSEDPEWARILKLKEGKSLVEMNADAIKLRHPYPIERMVASMLKQMW